MIKHIIVSLCAHFSFYTRFFVRKIGYINFVSVGGWDGRSVSFLAIVSSFKPLVVATSNFADA